MLQPVKLLQVSFDRIIEIVENSRARYDCLALFGGQGMEVRRARLEDVTGIIKVCSDGWRETYQDLVPQSYIEQVVADYYNEERVTREYAEDTPITMVIGWLKKMMRFLAALVVVLMSRTRVMFMSSMFI